MLGVIPFAHSQLTVQFLSVKYLYHSVKTQILHLWSKSCSGKEIIIIINPLTPRSDKYVNSPYNFNILSSRQVMRVKKIINYM